MRPMSGARAVLPGSIMVMSEMPRVLSPEPCTSLVLRNNRKQMSAAETDAMAIIAAFSITGASVSGEPRVEARPLRASRAG